MTRTRFLAVVFLTAVLGMQTVGADSSCCAPCTKPQEYHSKTFFSGIKLFEVGKPTKEMFFINDRMTAKEENCWGGALQIVGYGGQSVNPNDLAQYFLPYGKCSLYVTESKPCCTIDEAYSGGVFGADYNRDIEARNFNIGTAGGCDLAYSGSITFAPKQTVAGIGFTWKQTLWKDCDDDPMFWFEASFPVEYRKNDMNLCEVVITGSESDGLAGLGGNTHVANMTQAFAQPGLLFGRIDPCAEHKWGVADIEIRFGYNSVKGDCCDMNGYLGFVAPTGTKVDECTARNMFPVIIGNNHHWGLMFGSHVGYDIIDRGHHMLRYELDMCSKWLFANHQVRSFDLVQQGNWSRYLEVYASLDQAATATNDALSCPANADIGSFGINALTQWVKVEPRFNTNVNTAFIYTYKRWEFDAGYNLYVRQAERIEANCFPEGISVKNITGVGETNIARNIRNNFVGSAISFDDYSLHTLQLCDIDLNSAAAPAVLSNTVYAGAAYNFDCWCFPGFVGLGAMYEFSLANASTDRWNVVGKFGFSY